MKPTKLYGVMLEPSVVKRVDALVKDQRYSRSEWIRIAIDRTLEIEESKAKL